MNVAREIVSPPDTLTNFIVGAARPVTQPPSFPYPASGDTLILQNLYNPPQQPAPDVVTLTNQQLQDLIDTHTQMIGLGKGEQREHIDENSPL